MVEKTINVAEDYLEDGEINNSNNMDTLEAGTLIKCCVPY